VTVTAMQELPFECTLQLDGGSTVNVQSDVALTTEQLARVRALLARPEFVRAADEGLSVCSLDIGVSPPVVCYSGSTGTVTTLVCTAHRRFTLTPPFTAGVALVTPNLVDVHVHLQGDGELNQQKLLQLFKRIDDANRGRTAGAPGARAKAQAANAALKNYVKSQHDTVR
jgi:hypothetical protein